MNCIYISPLCASYSLNYSNCLSCKYNLNLVNGNCLDINCQNLANNTCIKCNPGFALNSNQICQFSDPNCFVPLPARCGQCNSGYFVTFTGICQQLPPKCAAADMQTFACIQCQLGFQFDSNKNCIQQLPPYCQVADPKNPSLCTLCNNGFTLSNGICQQVQTTVYNCQAYNLATGACVTCISNYTLSAGACVPIPSNGANSGGIIIINNGGNSNGGSSNNYGSSSSSNTNSGSSVSNGGGQIPNRDPNCIQYNGLVCISCSNRYYFGLNNICYPVSPVCKDYMYNGYCSSCWPGYSVSGPTCIANSKTQDPFCKTFTAGGLCYSCYTGYYLNQVLGSCQALNTLCKTSNLNDGSCTSCFPGYALTSGKCTVTFQDPNCIKGDNNKGTCIQCSSNFYLTPEGKCKQANPLCKTFDPSTGACLTCYSGYVIQGIICILGGSTNIDVNCAQFSTTNSSLCVKCSNNYYINPKGVCAQFNTLCKTSNTTNGFCLSCYAGYSLQNGICAVGTGTTVNSDPNCKSTDANGVCTGCYSSFYLSQGKCYRLDPLCKNYTASMSQCASCYDGYTLSSGQCVVPSQAPDSNNDQYCIKSKGIYCITCANGYYLAPNGTCTQLNSVCKTSDMTNGACTDCYPGYVLSYPTCIVAGSVNIPYCQNVVGIACTVCISGYYVSNGGCALANILCATYDPNSGACWSCVSGYVFQNGTCFLPALGIDNYCQIYTNSYCSQCVTGYALVSYVCSPVDPNCTQFDNIQNLCKSCSNGKTPQGPQCV